MSHRDVSWVIINVMGSDLIVSWGQKCQSAIYMGIFHRHREARPNAASYEEQIARYCHISSFKCYEHVPWLIINAINSDFVAS